MSPTLRLINSALPAGVSYICLPAGRFISGGGEGLTNIYIL